MIRCLCTVVLATLALPAQAASTRPLDAIRSAKVDAIVHRTMRDSHVSGLELGISRDGMPIYDRAYGVIGSNPSQPLDLRTPMPIGSLTKSFTAAALNTLTQAGTLHDTDTLVTYFPAYTAGADITIDDLLTMRSGIPDYSELPTFDRTARLPIAPETLFARVADRPLDFVPGTRTEYANTNYLLAALIVEHVSGMPYAQYLRHVVLDPLHLRNTRTAPQSSPGFGCADLESDIEDMLRWLSTLDDRPERGTEIAAGMYADGFFNGAILGRPARFANGYVAGYSSFAAHLTRERTSVVLLADADSVDLGPLATSVAAIVLDIPEASPEGLR